MNDYLTSSPLQGDIWETYLHLPTPFALIALGIFTLLASVQSQATKNLAAFFQWSSTLYFFLLKMFWGHVATLIEVPHW
jgi:hypothetical protein